MAKGKQKNAGVPAWIYGLAGIVLLVVAYRVLAPGAAEAKHPQPREDITAAKIVSPSRYADAPKIARVYAMAARIPHVLDGLYCYCECSKHSGHRSLISCFESDHGAMCDICLGEVALAFRLAQEGKSLAQIRAAIDAQFSKG